MANASRRPGFWMHSLSGWVSIFKRFRQPEPVEVRAANALRALDAEPGPRRDLAVLQLRHDYELVGDDENANIEIVRALQVRFLALADEYPLVEERVGERFEKAPISKLLAAIVAQALMDGATEIEVGYREGRKDVFSVRYLVQNEWQTAMEVPHSLFRAVRGFALFVRDVTFPRVRDRLRQWEGIPSDLSIESPDERTIRIELIS